MKPDERGFQDAITGSLVEAGGCLRHGVNDNGIEVRRVFLKPAHGLSVSPTAGGGVATRIYLAPSTISSQIWAIASGSVQVILSTDGKSWPLPAAPVPGSNTISPRAR